VAHGGLVAAVSPVPAATFDEAPLNEFVADLPRLTPYAVRHEEAMRALLPAASALVPMTFGAVYRDEASVRAMLAARTRELQGYLDRVRGCYEWGLKVYRDAARWQASAAVESAELLRLAAEAAQATPGRAYLLRKQRERQVAAESDRLAAEALDGITARLGAARRTQRRALPAVVTWSRLARRTASRSCASAPSSSTSPPPTRSGRRRKGSPLSTRRVACRSSSRGLGRRTRLSEIMMPPLEGALAERLSLVDTLDHLLERGVVLAGQATVSLGGVELIYLGLNLIVASVETLRREAGAVAPPAGGASPARGALTPRGPAPSLAPPSGRPDVPSLGALGLGGSGVSAPPSSEPAGALASLVGPLTGQEGERPERGLARLVLALVELLRQLLERQAVRRVEGGSLTDEEIERMGRALMELEAKMEELRAIFDLTEDDLNVDLGPLGDLL
jgi:hypothetical protein